jgi:putative ABC transport system substrate-binding protein
MLSCRSIYIAVATIVLLGSPILASHAAARERIAVLVSSSTSPFEEALYGFQAYLAKQGVNADYAVYRLDNSAARAEQALQAIKKNGVRVVFTLGSVAAEAAAEKAPDIPAVSCLVLRNDMLAMAPNATGVGLEFPLETQFRWLKAILPKAKTIGVMYTPSENKKRVEDAARIARRLGLNLDAVEVYTAQDIPSALSTLSKRVDALWGLADRVTLSPQMAKHILLFAFRNKIPFIGPSDAWVKAGALYSLNWDYRDLGSQCGEMALQVLRGKKPKEIPRTSPRKVLYSVNLNTAEQIKVPIPEEIADKASNTY